MCNFRQSVNFLFLRISRIRPYLLNRYGIQECCSRTDNLVFTKLTVRCVSVADIRGPSSVNTVTVCCLYIDRCLQETCFASRQGSETLICRLVLDSAKCRKSVIEHITSTATEYHADPRNPTVLCKVIVSDLRNGTVKFNADLVLS